MPTKDPHIAVIDAQEQLEQIKLLVRQAIKKSQASNGPLTEDEKVMLRAIRQQAIDATRKVQDRLLEELESHARQTGAAHD